MKNRYKYILSGGAVLLSFGVGAILGYVEYNPDRLSEREYKSQYIYYQIDSLANKSLADSIDVLIDSKLEKTINKK